MIVLKRRSSLSLVKGRPNLFNSDSRSDRLGGSNFL